MYTFSVTSEAGRDERENRKSQSEPIQRQLSLLEIMRRANTGKNVKIR